MTPPVPTRSRNQIVADMNAVEQEASTLDPETLVEGEPSFGEPAEADPPPATALDRLKLAHDMMASALQAVVGTAAYIVNGSDFSPDTAFAMGEAAGAISKAKALLGRDIDDMERAARNSELVR